MQPTIEELETMLAAARSAEQAAAHQRSKELRESFRAFLATSPWEYDVTPKKLERYDELPGITLHPDCLYVNRRLNQEKLADWQAAHSATDTETRNAAYGGASDMRAWHGMKYVRTAENILTHFHGGTFVLNTPLLCSDEEWAQITANNIPEKFKR